MADSPLFMDFVPNVGALNEISESLSFNHIVAFGLILSNMWTTNRV